jgi:diaminohydroxyphosphoribosylaminopyrimidine deaminase / 5-amino-6-(5-phosphoribosylamino)uracil reductase
MAGDHDLRLMARALTLAARGLATTHPNPRVGCVIARDGQILGEGWHVRAGGPHAEVLALAAAGGEARGATAYVTLEPCCHHGRTPPCTEALQAAGVRRVVFAAADPNPRVNGGGERALRAAGLEVTSGVLAAEAEQLNAGFNLRMRAGRPLVRSKIAASLDGRTAPADGKSHGEGHWITAEAARRDVQRWRARSSAVLTGVGTVLADDPLLNVRDPVGGDVRQPLRVILDAGWRTPATARLLAAPGQVLILGAGPEQRRAALQARGAEVVAMPVADGRVDLAAVLAELAAREVNELLVEAGPTLNGALLLAGLPDELIVYSAPQVLGDAARGMFTLALPSGTGLGSFRLRDVRRVGDDLRLIYTPAAGPGGGKD